MRRGCSVLLFVAGAWILASIGVVGLFPASDGVSPWFLVAIFAAFAAPFLLIGTWASPGRRMAELGLTLMIAAAVAATMVAAMAAITLDPAMRRFMPADMPRLDFASPAMIVSVLLIAAVGHGLRRRGMRAGAVLDANRTVTGAR